MKTYTKHAVLNCSFFYYVRSWSKMMNHLTAHIQHYHQLHKSQLCQRLKVSLWYFKLCWVNTGGRNIYTIQFLCDAVQDLIIIIHSWDRPLSYRAICLSRNLRQSDPGSPATLNIPQPISLPDDQTLRLPGLSHVHYQSPPKWIRWWLNYSHFRFHRYYVVTITKSKLERRCFFWVC